MYSTLPVRPRMYYYNYIKLRIFITLKDNLTDLCALQRGYENYKEIERYTLIQIL